MRNETAEEGIFFVTNNLILRKKNGAFLSNETPLPKIDNNDGEPHFDEFDFENRIHQEVARFIDHSFAHIVLLVGAGASVVMDDAGQINNSYGKTVAMLAQTVYDKLSQGTYTFLNYSNTGNKKTADIFSLKYMSETIGYCSNILLPKQCPGNPDKINTNEFNLEKFLSLLINYMNFIKNNRDLIKWQDSKSAIFAIIEEETGYEYDDSIFHHATIINILSKRLANENKLSIVTTNYDTLIEDAAESMNYTVFDGFLFARIPKFDDDMFEWHLSHRVPDIETRENIYKPQVIDLLKIHGSLTWRRAVSQNQNNSSTENTDYPALDGGMVRLDKRASGEPVMIFPSSDKYMQSYEEPYFELFSRFQELLKLPNTLLITTGFSFGDNHISRMIIQAISHNQGLYTLISDYTLEPAKPNKNWSELMNMTKKIYPIAFLKATLNGKLTSYLEAVVDER